MTKFIFVTAALFLMPSFAVLGAEGDPERDGIHGFDSETIGSEPTVVAPGISPLSKVSAIFNAGRPGRPDFSSCETAARTERGLCMANLRRNSIIAKRDHLNSKRAELEALSVSDPATKTLVDGILARGPRFEASLVQIDARILKMQERAAQGQTASFTRDFKAPVLPAIASSSGSVGSAAVVTSCTAGLRLLAGRCVASTPNRAARSPASVAGSVNTAR
jgi:hypothetical protein